jgi:hypothetical protein
MKKLQADAALAELNGRSNTGSRATLGGTLTTGEKFIVGPMANRKAG